MEKGKDHQHIQSPKNVTSPFLHQTELKFAVPWGHIAGIIK
jgi:hypothetical protein